MSEVKKCPKCNGEMIQVEFIKARAMNSLMEKGEIEDFGAFPDGTSGYTIAKGEAPDLLRMAAMFQPFIVCEANEIVPYEKQKEVQRAVFKAQIAATKK